MTSGPRNSYRDIKAEMTRRIASRIWAPGEVIPGEEALAREFGAARATVNRALQELARSGIVERKRKAGTRVALFPVREARLVIPLVRAEVEATGAAYGYRLLDSSIGQPPQFVRLRMELEGPAEMRHVRCLHSADGAPYRFEDRWINLAAAPDARRASFETIGPNEWLVANAPFSRAKYGFLAAAATMEEARLLALGDGAPVLVAERVTWLAEQAVTFVRMVHPPSHRIETDL